MVPIRHNTLSASRPASGIGPAMWDEAHSVPVATQAQAIAGLADDVLMTPERVGQAIAVAGREEVEVMLREGANVTITPSGSGAARILTISASVSAGGSPSWGAIGGTLSAQADLQTALDARQPLSAVLTGTTASFTTAQQTKLSGIATGATANAADAALRDRSTHTGAQAISTVTGLQTELDGKVASNPTGIAGADAITNIVSLTLAEYNAIVTKNATTFYVVTA